MDAVRHVAVEEAARAQAAGALLLDVREQWEFTAGHAPGALHLPMSELAARWQTLPAAAATLVVCRSGQRSDVVASALTRAGREGCANVAGGMVAWAAAGLPLEPAAGHIA
jgi:rhodanese-related sulfurtransferase